MHFIEGWAEAPRSNEHQEWAVGERCRFWIPQGNSQERWATKSLKQS